MRRILLALFTLVILAVGGFFGYNYFSQKSEVATTTKAKADEKNVPVETKKVDLEEASLMKTQTPTDRIWQFGFDEELDSSTVNTDNIKVTDADGKSVAVTPSLTNGEKTIQISPPAEGYKKGGSYNLSIKNGIAYASGKPVSKPFNMKFIIEREEVEEGKYSDKLIMVKENQINSTNEDSLVLNKNIKKGLKVNDIIVIPSKKNDVGKALKITSVESSGGSYTVTVTKPAFSELFDKLNIYKSYPIKPENITLAKGIKGVEIQSISESTPTTMIAASNSPTHNGEYAIPDMKAGYNDKDGFQFNFSGLKVPLGNNGEAEAEIEGSLAMLAPKVDADVDISFGKMKRLMFSQKGHMEQETTITLPGFEKEKVIEFKKKNKSKDMLRKQVEIGTIKVPVPYVPGLFIEGNILMELRMSASGEPKITFSVEIDDEKGVLYEKNKTTPTFKFKPDVDVTYSGKASGNVKFGPTGQIALSALEVVGAGIEAFEGAKIDGELAAEASTIKENFHACLSGSIGFVSEASVYVDVLDIFSKNKERIAEASLPEWEIWKRDINTCELYKKLIPSQKEIKLNAGEQTKLQVSAKKIDSLKLKTITEQIKNHKDLKITLSEQGVVKVEKTKDGLIIKALKQPSKKETVLKIKYSTEKSTFSNKQDLEVKVPITIKNFEESQPILNGKYQSGIGGVLNITNDKDNSFDFHISITGLGTPADVQGTATKSQNIANFTDPDYGCKIKFTLNGNNVIVKEENIECLNWHGPAIDTNGTYIKISDKTDSASSSTEESTPTSGTLADLNIVKPEDDKKIQALVGTDYSLLVESSKEYQDGIVDQDGWGAETGYGAAIPGEKECIIINGVDYKYIGLIINGNKVRFYTNNPVYKNKLPNTVENWRAVYDNYSVEYVYKDI